MTPEKYYDAYHDLEAVADALAAAVEELLGFSPQGYFGIPLSNVRVALAEYRKIRPQSAPEPILRDLGQ